MSVLIVIQARLGSTRLPGKVLLPLGNKTVLQHVVERCQRTGYPVVVATPAEELKTGAFACGIPCGFFGGPGDVEDVLGRYASLIGKWDVNASRFYGIDNPPSTIVRITADCPLVDPRLIEAAVQAIRSGYQYAGNTVERHWPKGLDVEAFTTELLLRAHKEAVSPYDREHVTPWMQRNSIQYALPASVLPLGAPETDRWCLDTPQDLEWLQEAFNANGDPSVEWVAAYAEFNPPPTDYFPVATQSKT